MTKNKIAFAGFMGAILMSVGAANAATTSVATKGYVDQQVKTVQGSVTTLENTIKESNYVTIQDVTDAIESGNIDLSAYQVTENMVQALTGIANPDEKYPSVAAVAAAIENLDLGLTTEQIEQLQQLIQSDGVVTQLSTLKGRVDTLTGSGEGSVAKSIADAISTHETAADAKYQAASTADLQIGTTGGKFRDMTAAEKAALASGITADKVTSYDGLTGENGVITKLQAAIDGLNGTDGTDGTIATIENTIKELQDAINGLNGTDGTVTTIQETITKLQAAIDGLNGKDGVDGTITTIEKTITELQELINDETTGLVAKVDANTAAIATKITMPADCASGNKTCVLMVTDGTISWTPVTSPVEDSGTTDVTE